MDQSRPKRLSGLQDRRCVGSILKLHDSLMLTDTAVDKSKSKSEVETGQSTAGLPIV